MWALIRRNRGIRLIVAYQLLGALQAGTYGLLFNLYLLALGRGEDLIGLLAGINTLALSFAALVAGQLVRRWGLRPLLTGGFLLASLSLLGQAIFTPEPLLIVFSVLTGFGYAMTQSLQMPLLAEYVSSEDRSTAAALISAIATLSTTVGTLMGGFLPALLGWTGLGLVERDRAALIAAVAVGVLGVIPLLRLSGGGSAVPQTFTAAIGTTQDDEQRSRVRRLVRQYAAATALISLGAGAFLPFVNVYLARLGANPGEIGGFLSAVGATGAILGLLAPTLARYLGRERLSVLMRVAPVLPALFLIFIPSIPLVVITYATRNIGAGMTWPIEASILNDRVHPRARAGAFGLRTAAWNLAWAFSSVVSGQIIVRGGYEWPLVILIASTVLGGIVLSLVLRPTPHEQAARRAAS
jgi:MFS family permease